MKVELLNKAENFATTDTIRTFLLHDFPKCLLAEFNTHRMLSRNWESSRARPVGTVISQVMLDPYIPKFTGTAKGMQGIELSDVLADRALYRWLNARDNAVTQAQEMIAIGIHKQDANRLLEPWMKVSGIVTGTEWNNLYNLRNHPHAQPAFCEFAAEMQRLDNATLAKPISIGEWYKPWPELNLAANTCKAASISYANHAKDRTDEDYLRIHDDLIDANPIHFSPTEHCAIATKAGVYFEDIETPFQVFDPLAPYDTVIACDDGENYSLVSTANFSGFLQYRKLLEFGLTVDVNSGAILWSN
jgi:hypothetical protein